MADAVRLDAEWLAHHPIPEPSETTDKDSRGRLLIFGGSAQVPGGLRLTAEAAFRAGAGKVQLGVPDNIALQLGVSVPECGVLGLANGGRDPSPQLREWAKAADCILVGPAMSSWGSDDVRVLNCLIENAADHAIILVDALALAAIPKSNAIKDVAARLLLTPNNAEMATLLGEDLGYVERSPNLALERAIQTFGCTIALRGQQTLIGDPNGRHLVYEGGGPGLATSGSGDVLVGAIGGLCSRGISSLEAASWGVWMHGESGAALFRKVAPFGFLARDLLAYLPVIGNTTTKSVRDASMSRNSPDYSAFFEPVECKGERLDRLW